MIASPTDSHSPKARPSAPVAIRWSQARLAELAKMAEGEGPEGLLAAAQLKAAMGDFEAAGAAARALFDQYPEPGQAPNEIFFPLFEALFVVQRFDLAARMVSERFDPGCAVELLVADPGPGIGRLIWDVHLPDRMRFTFDTSIIASDATHAQVLWFLWIFPLFATYARNWPGDCGSVVFNQWDSGLTPGLAMCDNRPGYFLVPCNAFTRTHAYQFERDYFTQNEVPWTSRKPIAFWRGATTGRPSDPVVGWRSLPRIRLCEIAQSHGDLLDAGISGIVQIVDPAVIEAIRSSGLMRSFVPVTDFNKYKYQIDIDGNTNAWPALFQKLLTGSPVLKVTSPYGFRQWYYDRLKPWINFVPVESDMSDLVEKIRWLGEHDDAAQAIGEQGQALALSLQYDRELKRAVPTIAAALRYFAGRVETELHFGRGEQSHGCLRDGWHDPVDGAVPARGFESRIELPRPIAPEDFVLSLDLSPCPDLPLRQGQRVAVVVNGDVLRHWLLTERSVVDCSLPRQTMEAAESLTITLLHPDAMLPASPERPLEARVMSLLIHSLALSPVSVYAASGRVVPAAAISQAPDHRGSDKASGLLYGPDIWLPAETKLRPLMTFHGTRVFADVANGRLRHGSPETTPRNVVIAKCGGKAYLLHLVPDGARHSIRIPREQVDASLSNAAAGPLRWLQSFRMVDSGPNGQGAFALLHDGLFLCSEPDGRVTLSRQRIGLWEYFHFELLPDDHALEPAAGTASEQPEIGGTV